MKMNNKKKIFGLSTLNAFAFSVFIFSTSTMSLADSSSDNFKDILSFSKGDRVYLTRDEGYGTIVGIHEPTENNPEENLIIKRDSDGLLVTEHIEDAGVDIANKGVCAPKRTVYHKLDGTKIVELPIKLAVDTVGILGEIAGTFDGYGLGIHSNTDSYSYSKDSTFCIGDKVAWSDKGDNGTIIGVNPITGALSIEMDYVIQPDCNPDEVTFLERPRS